MMMASSGCTSSRGASSFIGAVIIAVSLQSQVAADSVWVYTWPYGDHNSCKCEERGQSGTRYLEFPSASDCLESFSLEEAEFCTHEGQGLTQKKCESAVSVANGYFNSDCRTLCTEVLTGMIPPADFFATCDLELIAEVDSDTFIPVTGGSEKDKDKSTCFSNFVYGWADYDPHNNIQGAPIREYSDVDTPASCQELCQFTSGCAFFSWRAAVDSEERSGGNYQSPVHTCLLYSKAYVDGVLGTSMQDVAGASLKGPTEYCDVESYKAVCADAAATTVFNPFSPTLEKCLLCGCVNKCSWATGTHITGPRFCGDNTADVCNYPLSDFTTTTTTPECPTQTCVWNRAAVQAAELVTELVQSTIELEETASTIELDETASTTQAELETTTGIELDESTTTGIELDVNARR